MRGGVQVSTELCFSFPRASFFFFFCKEIAYAYGQNTNSNIREVYTVNRLSFSNLCLLGTSFFSKSKNYLVSLYPFTICTKYISLYTYVSLLVCICVCVSPPFYSTYRFYRILHTLSCTLSFCY